MYNDPFARLLLAPDKRWLRHGLVISLLAIIVFTGDASEYPAKMHWILLTGTLLMVLALPYLNMYLLVPKFLFRGKYVQYTIAVIVSVSMFAVLFSAVAFVLRKYQINPAAPKEETLGSIASFVISLSILIAATSAIKLFQRWVKDNYRLARLENEQLNAELDQLKSQVNPHFLLNMLNNVNVLTRTNPEKASEVLYTLSDLLRYQLYSSTSERVPLVNEIRFLHDLLDLAKVRKDNFNFTLRQTGGIQHEMVPPLLFITFVENAVKYSADPEQSSFVNIEFGMVDKQLVFTCFNSKPRKPIPNLNGPGGLGLSNVRRRLELLYPGKHHLNIQELSNSFSITLILQK
ncbi:histidine kinase [Pseudoflavitalea sp. G-6-1-2]|uniref:sensor histidine kinase n=1 Tax=Pseudoflavitalea sp. G-6-1-2 TaxID=2728841 RepID=UPI00146EA540|nr:histidine kinase [Pseudoflavitalea sp. G-6-1-2]NML20804.1 histidine kinase [Pseudoflavitalea sp. G-6-1-2]